MISTRAIGRSRVEFLILNRVDCRKRCLPSRKSPPDS